MALIRPSAINRVLKLINETIITPRHQISRIVTHEAGMPPDQVRPSSEFEEVFGISFSHVSDGFVDNFTDAVSVVSRLIDK
mgnify:CR=1 FL=1